MYAQITWRLALLQVLLFKKQQQSSIRFDGAYAALLSSVHARLGSHTAMRLSGGLTRTIPYPVTSPVHDQSRTLMRRRVAPLLGCRPAATATSASATPTTAPRARVADGASAAMASSAAASSVVSAPGARACAQPEISCVSVQGCLDMFVL